jgi:hypothetical protein
MRRGFAENPLALCLGDSAYRPSRFSRHGGSLAGVPYGSRRLLEGALYGLLCKNSAVFCKPREISELGRVLIQKEDALIQSRPPISELEAEEI